MMIRKKALFHLSAVMVIYLSACKANGSSDNNKNDIQVLPVIQLQQKDTLIHNNYVTAIEAKRNVEIRAKVPGFLDKIYVDEGQEVKQGQLLFQLNDKEYRLALDKAKASLANMRAEARAAELELERVRILVNKKIISPTEQELAQAKLKAAEARVSEALSVESEAANRLSYTFIYAPFSGIIDRIPLRAGSLVSEGALLTTVSDLSSVYAYFNVSENEYLQRVQSKNPGSGKLKDTAALILANDTRYTHTGYIETMESEFDEGTGSIAFRATFPNPAHLLKHGASGKVQLVTPLHEALLVPQKAVFEIQDKNYVFVVNANNTVSMRNFIPARRISDFYVVQSGLSKGEKIVVEGIQTLRDGIQIQPRTIPMDSLLATAGRHSVK
jgi:membrane fusion protein (multidrug efflux system)